jgi:hypothetical protein
MSKSYELTKINHFTYTLKIHGDNFMYLYNSINKIVKTSQIDYDTNTIYFSAENVTSLKKHILTQKYKCLSHGTCIKLIDDLTKQILYLHSLDYGFYGFDIDDILTIDNTFIFCSTQYLLPLDNDNIIFVSPIKLPYFSNPEVYQLTRLPTIINYKCCYYSFGSLIVFCLLHIYLLVGNEFKTTKEIDNIIQPLFNTKIYWFIKRCLEDDINRRRLLLI